MSTQEPPDVIYKDPGSTRPYTFDWADALPPGYEIASVATDVEGASTDPALEVVAGSSAFDGTSHSFALTGGADTATYKVALTVDAKHSGKPDLIDVRRLTVRVGPR
jgi:hypothetical protein